jgi:hypothetical protein
MVSISENQFSLTYEMFQDLLHPEGGNPQLVRENFHQSVRPLTMIISSIGQFYDPLLNLVGLAHYLHLPLALVIVLRSQSQALARVEFFRPGNFLLVWMFRKNPSHLSPVSASFRNSRASLL